MAMNVGELVATLDVDDQGYSRGLVTAAAEAKVAADRIEDHLDDVDAPAAGRRTGAGMIAGLLGAVRAGKPRLSSAGADAGGGISGGLTKAFGAISSNVYVMVGVVAAALAVLPLIGATVGVALALGFGGAIAGIGLAAAAQAEEVQDAFSDLKSNVVRDLKAMAEPLQGTLVDVAGDLQGLFDSLSPHLEDAFAEMAPVLSTFSEQLFGAMEGIGPVIDDATEAFNELLGALGPELEGSLDGIWDALSGLFDTISANPEPFAGIITGALDLVAGVIKLVDWLSQAYVWINDNVPGGLMGLLSPLILVTSALTDASEKGGGFTDAMRTMGQALVEAWGYIRDGATELWEALEPILSDLWEALASSDVLATIQEWWGQLAEIFTLGGELIGEILSLAATALTWIWTNFGTEIIGVLSGVWEIISGIFSGALEVIKGILNTVLGVITGDWSRAWEGIKQIGSGIWTAIKGIIGGAITVVWNGLKATLKLISNIWSSVWGGIKSVASSVWSSIKSTVSSAISSVRSTVSSVMSSIRSAISSAWSAVKSATSNAWSALKSSVSNGIKGALTAVRNTISRWRSVGRDIVQGIINGVTGKAGALYSKLRGMASSALSAAKDALGISSPSRVMRDQVGRWIPEGIAAGLDLGQRKLGSKMARMADDLTLALPDRPAPGTQPPSRPEDDPRGRGSAVWIEHFHAREHMSADDVGEALWGLVTARGGV